MKTSRGYFLALVVFASSEPFYTSSVTWQRVHRWKLPAGLDRRRFDVSKRSRGLDLMRCRGGSSTESAIAETEDEEDDANQANEESVEEEDVTEEQPALSTKPVRVVLQTNLGSKLLDHTIELDTRRTKTIQSIKTSACRKLPGKPPLLYIELVCDGEVLDDEMLVDELIDEEDEAEETEDGYVTKTLILNIVPPVDEKFGIDLDAASVASMTTEELLDAYFLNQAAMIRNAQSLADPNIPSDAMLRIELQNQAKQFQDQLQSETPDDVWQESMKPIETGPKEEWHGQRYRNGKGGATTNLRRTIQHNLNINWMSTTRHAVLLIFFGVFGGRSPATRQFMLALAPLCFLLQVRPVKLFAKEFFYLLSNPPSVFLSFLPAPSKAILTVNKDEIYEILYSTAESSREGKDNEEEAIESDELTEESEAETMEGGNMDVVSSNDDGEEDEETGEEYDEDEYDEDEYDEYDEAEDEE